MIFFFLRFENLISARQTTSGGEALALVQAANKVIEKSLSSVNKTSPPKQVLQQQLQQKKADQAKKQLQQEQLQQKNKMATNAEKDKLASIYQVSNQVPFSIRGRS